MNATASLPIMLAIALAGQPDPSGNPPWNSTVLLESEQGLGGVAIGDLDPATPGDEVVTVDAAGGVWLVGRRDDQWNAQRIHQGKGELIMCAIGDVDRRYPGDEFVGVGMVSGGESLTGPGQVLMIRKDGDHWVATPIFVDDHMLHGVAIGDISSRHPGNAIVAAGFNHCATLIYLNHGEWKHETMYVGNDRLKIACIADVLTDRAGLETVVCGSDGTAVAIWEGALGWHHEVIFADPVGQSRVAAAHETVLIGGDGGKITLARRDDATWTREFIGRDTGKIRGVVIRDPSTELYACGYSAKVTRFIRDQRGFWIPQTIFTADKPLHHLVSGDIDVRHPGLELVTCGHGGRLILLRPGG